MRLVTLVVSEVDPSENPTGIAISQFIVGNYSPQRGETNR
jgi:hypothetical protein